MLITRATIIIMSVALALSVFNLIGCIRMYVKCRIRLLLLFISNLITLALIGISFLGYTAIGNRVPEFLCLLVSVALLVTSIMTTIIVLRPYLPIEWFSNAK